MVYKSHPTYWFFTPFVKQIREKSHPFIDDDVSVMTPMPIEEEYELVEIKGIVGTSCHSMIVFCTNVSSSIVCFVEPSQAWGAIGCGGCIGFFLGLPFGAPLRDLVDYFGLRLKVSGAQRLSAYL